MTFTFCKEKYAFDLAFYLEDIVIPRAPKLMHGGCD